MPILATALRFARGGQKRLQSTGLCSSRETMEGVDVPMKPGAFEELVEFQFTEAQPQVGVKFACLFEIVS